MSLRLWIETTYHAAFRYGGWAYLRDAGGTVSGVAGGERNTTAARIDLMALAVAFQGLPAGAVTVTTASPGLLAAGRLIERPPAPQDAPTEDLDLWVRVLGATAGRVVTFKVAPRAPQTPAAFLHAWAEVGQDKAKVAGRFSAAIPKSNLAKLKLD
jgi:hypothetical protein